MIFYGLTLASGFLAVWFLRVVRKPFYQLAQHTLATLNSILSPEEDEAKLQSLQKSATGLLIWLLLIMLLLVTAAGILYIPLLLKGTLGWVKPDVYNALYWGLAVSAGASVPFFIPLPQKASGYSELAQLLHRLILNHYYLGLRLLKWELKKHAPQPVNPQQPFVIVSGLARAGTTSLMNLLVQEPCFTSLSYAQMPFLLSPRTWQKWYKPSSKKVKERSHKDGIQISYQSSEALEEYFFKALLNDAYLGKSTLKEHHLSPKECALYARYQRLIAGPNQLYLAKNNNFLLRYRSVRKAFPNFLFALLFRHPLYQAASLLAMHKRYSQLQSQDPFVLEYMNWLGHHEFGQNHKWFAFSGHTPPATPKDTLDYWLEVWINYYQKALEIEDANTVFINYHELCQNPAAVLDNLSSKIGLEFSGEIAQGFSNKRKVEEPKQTERLAKALKIYERLKLRATPGT